MRAGYLVRIWVSHYLFLCAANVFCGCFPPPHLLTPPLPAVCSAEEDYYDDDDDNDDDDDDDNDDDDGDDGDDDDDDDETIMLLPQALPIFSRSRKLGTRAFFFVAPQNPGTNQQICG